MRRVRLDSATRRAQIALAVLELVQTRGLRALSVGAVARRVGIAPSAIYRHYRSKDAMLDAVVDLVRDRIRENLEAAGATPAGALAQLETLLARQIRLIRENQALPRILFSEDFYAGHPERKQRVLAVMMGFVGAIAERVRSGQLQGEIRPDLDPRVVAVMFIGLFQPAAFVWSLSEGGFDVTRQARDAWPLFRDAIAASGPSSASPPAARARRTRSEPEIHS